MDIKRQPMGEYQTNCYIVTIDKKDLIIDPGVESTSWVIANTTNPVAILNTHGHFDHVWCNAELHEKLGVPIYAPKDDAFMLEKSEFFPELQSSYPNFAIEGDEEVDVDGIKVKFTHFPGHTPGCSVIEIGEAMFSGDFIFKGSIGRWDFPFSSAQDMRESLKKFKLLDYDRIIYPGHGEATSIKEEQRNVSFWLEQVR
ncbi:MAG: MBL fold metallo-hydrolase [Helicobacteraceae bacterium]|nr:MBL fold metallo-hydrolase [Helicobacteraceae bacterium]